MGVSLPEPSDFFDSRTHLFEGYLDYLRARIVEKVSQLPESERRSSRLASGWTPMELIKHLTFVEMRWLEWGFEGRDVDDPWGIAATIVGTWISRRPSLSWRPR